MVLTSFKAGHSHQFNRRLASADLDPFWQASKPAACLNSGRLTAASFTNQLRRVWPEAVTRYGTAAPIDDATRKIRSSSERGIGPWPACVGFVSPHPPPPGAGHMAQGIGRVPKQRLSMFSLSLFSRHVRLGEIRPCRLPEQIGKSAKLGPSWRQKLPKKRFGTLSRRRLASGSTAPRPILCFDDHNRPQALSSGPWRQPTSGRGESALVWQSTITGPHRHAEDPASLLPPSAE